MGRDKNGMGNRELKELTCTTPGHELRCGMLEVWGVRVRGGIKEGKIWGNCNSIINKNTLKICNKNGVLCAGPCILLLELI